MGKLRHGGSQWFGCTCVQGRSHSWELNLALVLLPEPAVSELLAGCWGCVKLRKGIGAGPQMYLALLAGMEMERVPRSSGGSLRCVNPNDLEITAFNINYPSFQVFEVSFPHHNA